MRKTFACDESMIITIPIGSLKTIQEGQLMPENFHCVFRDNYKVFAVRGKPKPLGAAQAIGGVFAVSLGVISQETPINIFCIVSCVLFLISGMLSFAAGKCPNIHVTKLSFSLNIISFFWSLAAFSVFVVIVIFYGGPHLRPIYYQLVPGIAGLIMTLLVFECMMALFLIYWLSKAVCREHFNTLPIIMLKQED
ncbi:membrane-spanning 4-domains subfamily A member 4A-like [Fundulus heteroclitus]|uniref:membrane-spanning 4-domains subfamily A member 4A-like n=1 Tax=Fundulus heteroclitus TaxID=8078 RepID=UPI00165A834A|nr:membrane-spanning 4-domains subfamily A member 4A-like [Fundulus heteroclitus]